MGTRDMRVILSPEELADGIARLSAELGRAVGRRPLTIVGVLTGSIIVVADLIRRLEGPVQVSMVWASSYRGTATSPGSLELRLDLLPDLTGQDVLIVDDIFDTGRTLQALVAEFRRRGAASVRSLVLLRKEGRAEVTMQPDFVGFDIPDVFVVGYGLDFDGAWRHLPYLAALDDDDIAATRAARQAAPPDAPRHPQPDPVGGPRA
jgi:hypoxanthine phosphoribosyltransferase